MAMQRKNYSVPTDNNQDENIHSTSNRFHNSLAKTKGAVKSTYSFSLQDISSIFQ